MKNLFYLLKIAALLCIPWMAQAQTPIPYTYGFEDEAEYAGWTVINLSSSNTAQRYGGAAQTGSYGFRFSSYNSANIWDQYLISPELSGTESGMHVEFSYKASSNYGSEVFAVGYSTTDTALASFTWGTEVVASGTDWHVHTADMPNDVKYFAIHYYSHYKYYLYVDNISLLDPLSCFPVTNLAVSNIQNDGCTISWHPNGNESTWIVSLDGVEHATVYDTIYTFNGLDANTIYYYGVKAFCGVGDSSTISNGTFKTDCLNSSCNLTINATNNSVWGYPTVDVIQNGDIIASVSGLHDVGICSGDSVIVKINSVGSYPSFYSPSVIITDVGGAELVSVNITSMSTGDTLLAVANGCPSCIPPSGLTVDTALTDTTAISIHWHGVDTVVGYIVAINGVEVDDNPITDSVYTFTGLSPASPYVITVRTLCSNEDTSYYSTINTMTDCGILTITEDAPYFCNFEAYEGEQAIPCWTMNPTYVIKGDGGLFFRSHSAGHAAIMPMINQPVNTLEVVFGAKVGTTGDDPDDVVIGVANAAGDSVVWLDTLHDANQSRAAFTEFSYRFNEYTGDLTRIAFTNKNNISNWMLIDNLMVRIIPTCVAPSTIVGHNLINADSSYFTWVDAGEAGSFQVVIGSLEDNINDIEGLATNITDTSYLVPANTLTPGTKYIFYVRSNCGDFYSEWKTLEFAAGTVIMPTSGTDTVSGCGLVVYDNGGPYSGYIGGTSSTVVIYPDTNGDIVKVTGGWVATYEGNSTLRIYDGESTNGIELYSTTNTDSIPELIGEEGPITIKFNAGSFVTHGFELFTTCVNGPTCFKPKNVTASNIQPESVDLTWTYGNATEVGGSFHVYYRHVGETNWSVYEANDMTATITGLTNGTNYELYVRGFCSDVDSSIASTTIYFTTPCYTTIIDPTNSIVESFESEAAPAECFTILNTGSHTTSKAYSGSRSLELSTSGATLISPLLTTTGLTNVKFMYAGSGSTWGTDNFRVGYSTTGLEIADFTWYGNVNAINTTWEEYFDTLPAGTTYIAIRFNSGYMMYIDSLVIEANNGTMPCAKPVITSTSAGVHNLNVNWTSANDTCYVAIMQGNWDVSLATDIMVLGGFYSFSGLTEHTNYTIGVRTICTDGNLSDYATVIVQTLASSGDQCDMPTITNTAVSDNSATVTFTGTTDSYEVEIVEGNWMGSMGNQISIDTNSYTFANLEIGTQYTIAVRGVCDEGDYSEWATSSFTVEGDIECNAPSNLHTVNLTSTMASIDWDVNGSENSWQMLFEGQVRPVGSHPYILNNLAPGTDYTIRVRAVCNSSENSDWSDEYTFHTLTDGINNVDGIVVRIYPNPATSIVTIELGEPAQVDIVDLNGREIYKAEANEELSVNVATIAKGAYFVRIVGDNGTVVRKLIVK